MSNGGGAYAGWGAEAPDQMLPGSDLTNYVGHAVYLTGGELAPLSITDQATTQTNFGAGVLLEGAPDDPGAQCRVVEAGIVEFAVAGTGGVAIGDTVAPEYSATAANQGRFIARTTAQQTDGDIMWGTAITAASAGGTFRLQLWRQKAHFDGTGA
jgi:hypothetical protein